MNKILISLFILALLSGCQSNIKSSIPDAYAGFEGIDAAFVAQSVPATLTSGASSEFLVKVSNKGAVDFSFDNLVVVLRDSRGVLNFKPALWPGSDVRQAIIPPPKSMAGKASNGYGSAEAWPVSVEAKSLPATQSSDLFVTACYQYQTKFSANVCIDTEGYSLQKQQKPCDYRAPLVFRNQGAPVAVVKVETLLETTGTGVKPSFKVFLKNVGNGVIVESKNVLSSCMSEGEAARFNVVDLDSAELNGKKLECVPKSLGIDNKNYFLCTYPDSFNKDSGVFVTPLKMTFNYGYSATSKAIPITVEKALGP